MTQDELKKFLIDAERGEQVIAEILAFHTASHAKLLASLDGETLTDEQAEEIAAIRRKEFVEGIRILEDGGALAPDMWRPIMPK